MSFSWQQCGICQDSVIFGYECDNTILKHLLCRECILGMAVRRTTYQEFHPTQAFLNTIPSMPACPMCVTSKNTRIRYQQATLYNANAAEHGLPCDFYDDSGIQQIIPCQRSFHKHVDRDAHIKDCDEFNKLRYLRILPHLSRLITHLAECTQTKQYHRREYLKCIEDNINVVKALAITRKLKAIPTSTWGSITAPRLAQHVTEGLAIQFNLGFNINSMYCSCTHMAGACLEICNMQGYESGPPQINHYAYCGKVTQANLLEGRMHTTLLNHFQQFHLEDKGGRHSVHRAAWTRANENIHCFFETASFWLSKFISFDTTAIYKQMARHYDSEGHNEWEDRQLWRDCSSAIRKIPFIAYKIFIDRTDGIMSANFRIIKAQVLAPTTSLDFINNPSQLHQALHELASSPHNTRLLGLILNYLEDKVKYDLIPDHKITNLYRIYNQWTNLQLLRGVPITHND